MWSLRGGGGRPEGSYGGIDIVEDLQNPREPRHLENRTHHRLQSDQFDCAAMAIDLVHGENQLAYEKAGDLLDSVHIQNDTPPFCIPEFE